MDKDIKKFEMAGKQVIVKEMRQLHNRTVGRSIILKELTSEQRKATLRYLMFLKRKHNDSVKDG